MKVKNRWMIFGMIGLLSAALSGCVWGKKLAVPLGATDYIFCPKGSEIAGVPLPTNEKKSYTIVTPKDGFWISKSGFNRMEMYVTGSNPEDKNG